MPNVRENLSLSGTPKNPLNARGVGFPHDPTGNALNRNTLGQNRTYTYNALNQMVSGTVPTATDAAGTVGPGIVEPKVTVNNIPVPPAEPDPDGNWIVKNIPLTSGENILTTLVKDKFNRTKSDVRTVTVAPAPEFSYDLNGNMLSLPSLGSLSSLGSMELSWNDENRLVSVEEAGRQRLEFLYDGQGRRRIKRVYSWSGSDRTLENESRYVYDQWNEVAELDAENQIASTQYWGIDLSGSEQGAGGVGGLLAIDSHAFHFPVYDGNGNITAYTDSTDTVIYSCFYTPFGKVIDENGTAPSAYGFSTKPLDSETGLVYYLFRDYSPELGRWISRDPIEEEGGWNVYMISGNNSISRVDFLGESWIDPIVNTLDFAGRMLNPANWGGKQCCGGKPLPTGMECCRNAAANDAGTPYDPNQMCCKMNANQPGYLEALKTVYRCRIKMWGLPTWNSVIVHIVITGDPYDPKGLNFGKMPSDKLASIFGGPGKHDVNDNSSIDPRDCVQQKMCISDFNRMSTTPKGTPTDSWYFWWYPPNNCSGFGSCLSR